MENRRGVAFAVDQLKDADHLAFGVLHRQGEHRARAIAGVLIVLGVEVIRAVGRDVVGVRNVDHLAVERDVAGHRSFRDRQGVLGERELAAVVLRELESQPLLVVADFFHQVE